MKEIVSESIIAQFKRALTMFKEAVLAFPESEWKIGDTNYLRPAGVGYHVVETIEFYVGDQPAGVFKFGARFGVDWEASESEKFPTQKQLLEYLDEVWRSAEAWMSVNDLTQPEKLFSWTGKTLLSRMGYLLRHIQHHTAEMALELTRRGYQAPQWK